MGTTIGARALSGGRPVTREDVQRWLDAYVEAWRTSDPAAIADLFGESVEYRYQPYGDPVVGREAVVADWLEEPDAAGSWQAHYEPYAVDGDRAVAVGASRYLKEDGSLRTVFSNAWLLRFDGDGRCAEFTEYWREHPKDQLPAG
jgi:ketosteroid isomerase-like protein